MNATTEDSHNPSTPSKALNIDSHYFQQFIQSSPEFQSTDKNKLFEAFVMFQHMLNQNKHSAIPPKPSLNTSTTLPQTAASSTAKTFDSTTKAERPPETSLNKAEPTVKKELLFLSTEKKPQSKDKQTHNPTITKYDDLPIKISNSNYIETTESKFINKQHTSSTHDMHYIPQSKRRFIKSNRNKTLLSINSNNKQYSNYTEVSKETNVNKHTQQQCKPVVNQVKTFKSSFAKDEGKHVNAGTAVSKEQLLEQDIATINDEINKFKEERKKIMILKSEYEKLYLRLQEDFQQLSVKEKEFDTYKETESNKIKAKQKAIDECLKLCNDMKSQNCSLSMNAKKDKEQIHALNEEINLMRNEHKQKEINNKILIDKLKKQNEELQTQLQLHLNKQQNDSGEGIKENNTRQHKVFNVSVGNKVLIQQNENEEELQLPQGTKECMSNTNTNINTYNDTTNVNDKVNHRCQGNERVIELDRLSGSKEGCNVNEYCNNNDKVVINHTPISSCSNNQEVKVRKLMNKQLTSSSTAYKDKYNNKNPTRTPTPTRRPPTPSAPTSTPPLRPS